jgi:hypothetical protein
MSILSVVVLKDTGTPAAIGYDSQNRLVIGKLTTIELARTKKLQLETWMVGYAFDIHIASEREIELVKDCILIGYVDTTNPEYRKAI